MSRFLIVADDLSGAADCGVAWARAGLNAVISLRGAAPDTQADAWVIDADTRRMDEEAASARVEHLIHTYAADPAVIVFKKMDSTLRGHPAAELTAALRARRSRLPETVAVLAPAFPAMGRLTLAGIHHLHGRPLHETEMWQYQKSCEEAHIPRMLEAAGMNVAHLDLSMVRGSGLHDVLERNAGHADTFVCDVQRDSDLESIAHAGAALGPRILWAGSAGLAGHLPRALKMDGAPPESMVPLPHHRAPILFVIGSMAQTSREQLRAIVAAEGVCCIQVPRQLLARNAGSAALDACVRRLHDAMEAGQDVVLTTSPEPGVGAAGHTDVARGLARIAAPLRHSAGALVASGGETARMVLDAWNVTALRVRGEVAEGIPISVTECAGTEPLIVITKAGDFGSADALLQCRAWLRDNEGRHL